VTKNIVLISFYNPKSLGLRSLESALALAGFDVTIVYFKNFNSVSPKLPTAKEFEHLKELIEQKNPFLIGFSVMTSLYLETVEHVSTELRKHFKIPMVWGGVYATMFYKKCMDFTDFVIRSEGEEAIIELANALQAGDTNYSKIKNLAYRCEEGFVLENELRHLLVDLDAYGLPNIGGNNKYLIEENKIVNIDPIVNSYSYEMSCSRGCLFGCSYCCAINLKQINASKGAYVRFREVDHVIDELLIAKKSIKKLKFIRFWDEIFAYDKDWVDAFIDRYKREIKLPFEIWAHPLKCNEELIEKLCRIGLYKVVMGIQSGSPYIRKEIFNRHETQEQIIEASNILSRCGVPQVIYDFMLRHPFETKETLMETYELCKNLAGPFELQLHGLNFLPGTNIVKKALDMNLVSKEVMEHLMYAPMQEQYERYWQNDNKSEEMNHIYKMIYLTQYPVFKGQLEKGKNLNNLYKMAEKMTKMRYVYKKGVLVIKGSR